MRFSPLILTLLYALVVKATIDSSNHLESNPGGSNSGSKLMRRLKGFIGSVSAISWRTHGKATKPATEASAYDPEYTRYIVQILRDTWERVSRLYKGIPTHKVKANHELYEHVIPDRYYEKKIKRKVRVLLSDMGTDHMAPNPTTTTWEPISIPNSFWEAREDMIESIKSVDKSERVHDASKEILNDGEVVIDGKRDSCYIIPGIPDSSLATVDTEEMMGSDMREIPKKIAQDSSWLPLNAHVIYASYENSQRLYLQLCKFKLQIFYYFAEQLRSRLKKLDSKVWRNESFIEGLPEIFSNIKFIAAKIHEQYLQYNYLKDNMLEDNAARTDTIQALDRNFERLLSLFAVPQKDLSNKSSD